MQRENKLGEKIASLRRSRGLTQAELAEKLNFTHQAVSNQERGVSEPDTSTLIRLSGYFGVTTDELLGTEDGQPAEPVPPAREAVRISPARARNDASDTLTQYFRQYCAPVRGIGGRGFRPRIDRPGCGRNYFSAPRKNALQNAPFVLKYCNV